MWGLRARACTPCRDRVCRKDDQGFVAVPYAEQERGKKEQQNDHP